MEPSYRVNSPTVAHENIDGETMVIHFETGAYYNLQGSALLIWDQVVDGATADDIVAAVRNAFQGDPGVMRQSVLAFLEELAEEHLVVPMNGSAPARPDSVRRDPGAMRPFESPQLNKYTDMQDFLLADPVHDTDDAGFPIPKAQRDT
jgi:hypothetical protein